LHIKIAFFNLLREMIFSCIKDYISFVQKNAIFSYIIYIEKAYYVSYIIEFTSQFRPKSERWLVLCEIVASTAFIPENYGREYFFICMNVWDAIEVSLFVLQKIYFYTLLSRFQSLDLTDSFIFLFFIENKFSFWFIIWFTIEIEQCDSYW